MRKSILGVLLLAASVAWAGETFLGTILVSDGGSVSNATTGYGSAGCGTGGACAQAFRVPTATPISIQAITACTVVVNSSFADAGNGVQLTAGQFFTSSTATTPVTVWPINPDGGTINSHGQWGGVPDGGTYTGGIVSIAPAAGAASAQVTVFSRLGNE